MPRFNDVVLKAWNEHCEHSEPYQLLFHKIKKTTTRLTEWSRRLFFKAKIHHHATLLVILQLGMTQENQPLSLEELDLRARLKKRVVSLAVLERARKKQCARVANLREGDASTKNFHRRINARRRKNHIHQIKHEHGWVTEHEAKEKILHEHSLRSWEGETQALRTSIGMILTLCRMICRSWGRPSRRRRSEIPLMRCLATRDPGWMDSQACFQ